MSGVVGPVADEPREKKDWNECYCGHPTLVLRTFIIVYSIYLYNHVHI
jgi:hypothetical protein